MPDKNIAIEYEVETDDGELVNCFTWAELKRFFGSVPKSTLRMCVYRGTVLRGQYHITQVRYRKEHDE